MNQLNKLLNVVFAVIIVGLIVSIVIVIQNQEKTGYIEISVVYNEFELTKELEAKLDKVQTLRTSILDSLELELTAMARRIKSNPKASEESIREFEIKKYTYVEKEKRFKEDDESLAQKYTEQIWGQLNQYIKDFGQSSDFQYIYGADGQGSIMFADQSLNITEEVKEYVNRRYSGADG